MKLRVSLSAPRLSADILMEKQYGTYHAGMQKVSNVGGKDVLWNYVKLVDGAYKAVKDKDEADGIAAAGKLFKFTTF